jgi:hypothetical protein
LRIAVFLNIQLLGYCEGCIASDGCDLYDRRTFQVCL